MERISQLQVFMLFVIYLYSTTSGFYLGPLSEFAGYEGPAALCLGSGLGLMLAYAALAVAKKRPGEFFVHYGHEIVGKWLHKLFVAVICLYFLHTAAVILREIQDFLVQTYLPNTPDWALSGILGICVAAAVRSGIENIFRFAQGFFFLIAGNVILGTLLLGQDLEFYRAVAFFTHRDPVHLWRGSLFTSAIYGELIMILLFFPSLIHPNRTFRSLGWAVGAGTLLVLMNLVPALLLFGPNLMSHLTYPTLEALRYIRLGDFLENLDPLLAAIWITAVFVKLSLIVFVTVFCLTQSFSLKDYRPFSFAVTAVIVGLSLHMSRNAAEFDNFFKNAEIGFSLCVESIPLVYLAADYARRRLGKRQAAGHNKNP